MSLLKDIRIIKYYNYTLKQPAMRRLLFTLLLALASVALTQAQSLGFSYQTVVRDASGQALENQQVRLRISLLAGTATGTPVYVETHRPTTSAYGVVSLTIGAGTQVGTNTFASINWASGIYFIKVEVDKSGGTNYTDMGVSQLLSVPFANYAFSGPVGKSAYQVWLEIPGNEGKTEQEFIAALQGAPGSVAWTDTDTTVTTTKRVGIGTQQPTGLLQVVGDSTDVEAPLFEVKNSQGESVFAIYEDRVVINAASVEINLDDTEKSVAKPRGGFAVSGRTSSKVEAHEIMLITPHETTFYVDETEGKPRGGFAVSGRTSSKENEDFAPILQITPGFTQVFVDDQGGKPRGGFAVSGRTSSKEDYFDILTVTPNLTQVYLNDTEGKPRGGFAVSGRTSSKEIADDILFISNDITQFYVGDEGGKPRGGFAVSGRTSSKEGEADFDIFSITPTLTQVYLNDTEGKPRGGFAVSGRTSSKTESDDILLITTESTTVFVGDDGAKPRGGFAVSGRTSSKGDALDIFTVTPT
jgi:hypothetical protein